VGWWIKRNSNVSVGFLKIQIQYFVKFIFHDKFRYIFWNEHEPYPGVYDFEGQKDVFKFIEIAQKIGFVVILRPGELISRKCSHQFEIS